MTKVGAKSFEPEPLKGDSMKRKKKRKEVESEYVEGASKRGTHPELKNIHEQNKKKKRNSSEAVEEYQGEVSVKSKKKRKKNASKHETIEGSDSVSKDGERRRKKRKKKRIATETKPLNGENQSSTCDESSGRSHRKNVPRNVSRNVSRDVSRKIPQSREESAGEKKECFHDSEEDESQTICVNDTYANRYAKRKRKEELQRHKDALEAAEMSETESSSSEAEDSEGEILTNHVASKVVETIARLRNKDPIVYQQEFQAFEDKDFEVESEPEDVGQKKKKSYGTLLVETLLAEGPDAISKEEDRIASSGLQMNGTYSSEQEEARQAFLDAGKETDDNEDDGGGLFTLKVKSEGETQEADKSYEAFLRNEKSKDEARLFASYLADDESLTANQKFLRDYVLLQGWKQGARIAPTETHATALTRREEKEDVNVVDATDEFESKYNFRHEQTDGTRLISFPRRVPGSVRQEEPSARARQRERKKQRQQEEKRVRDEETKHQKNLKKDEIRARIDKIRAVAGLENGINLDPEEYHPVEGDFDPAAHDAMMERLFGRHYDDADDDTFREAEESAAPDDQTQELDDPTYKQLVNELYSLDHEGIVGDLPTRFKYTQVEPDDYGLTTEEILNMSDKELNQHVHIGKLAPYRDQRREGYKSSWRSRKRTHTKVEDIKKRRWKT